MTLYMPPLATKKRGGMQKSCPDTKRVFGNYEENLPSAQSHYSTIHSNVPAGGKFKLAEPHPRSPTRQHNPHPSQVGFLLQDCRLLHEPICDVKPRPKAASPDTESNMWWKWRAGSGEETVERSVPKYSYNSTNRDELRKPEKPQQGQTRHGSNPGSHAATGIVPVTSLQSQRGPRLLVEHISYDHQYNSRTNPSHPIRGKRHGTFVWDCLHPTSPPKLTTVTHKTKVLAAPWASNTQEDVIGNSGKPPSSPLSSQTGSIKCQETVGLGTLASTVPQLTELPPVAS
ncbi:uncharacterized protein C2orf73 homolog [Acanthaster planci]|uniref:Uncharacterized protein C2orf73 homolog n=1 Tax=Acanthaster planci TaxID=133434 RepID=A0A8B7XYY0_ACAPL|nr:uncharacterized protein C2orf73 homolog [Acanthaster planci]